MTVWNLVFRIVDVLSFVVIVAAILFAAYHIHGAHKKLAETTALFSTITASMLSDFSTEVVALGDMIRVLASLSADMSADRGRVTATASVPNMPKLSGNGGPARHAADPSGEWTGLPLREALHENKIVMGPPIIEECFPCLCTISGFGGLHCHYHMCAIPIGADRCPHAPGALA